ncbi:MAG: AAA family ATPase [Clostridiales bacterium]|nr:AAA family ATPase [Clostridiales bacterium]
MAVDNKEIAVFGFSDDKCSATDPLDTEAFISPLHYFKAEAAIKKRIEKFLSMKVKVPLKAESDHIMSRYADKVGIVLDEAQKSALHLCMYCPLCIITGGPGTGKTTIMGILADYFRDKDITCVFAAPTGRAAKRLAESTGSPAATIHRLLGVRPVDDMTGNQFFLHDHSDPIKARVIVIDEMSMVDTELFERLLDATDEQTSLILVGDPDQLPSVGCGNVLRDLLSGRSIPSARLTYTHRQTDDSSIASNAYRILNGEPLIADGIDFEIIKTSNDEEAFERVKAMVKGLQGEDAVFLTPTKNENVMLGTVKLNSMLQELFVSEAGGKDELPSVKRGSTAAFYEGDRVMQTRNDYSAEWIDPVTNKTEQGVFNGEMGTVDSVDMIEGTMTVVFDDGKTVKYTKKMLEDIELAYAVTVHKSQGCEFEHVVILLGKMNALLYKRNLLYTAVTRGRTKVTIVDSGDTLARFLRGLRDEERATSLKDFLAIIDHKRGL